MSGQDGDMTMSVIGLDSDPRRASILGSVLSDLLEIEAHHVVQNRMKGRNEGRSFTLKCVRRAISKIKGSAE